MEDFMSDDINFKLYWLLLRTLVFIQYFQHEYHNKIGILYSVYEYDSHFYYSNSISYLIMTLFLNSIIALYF